MFDAWHFRSRTSGCNAKATNVLITRKSDANPQLKSHADERAPSASFIPVPISAGDLTT